MSPLRAAWRLAAVVLLSLAMALSMAPAQAATPAMPGSFTGYAFDSCQAPSQAKMDVWLERSPYWGVGIYIAGDNRYCKIQDHLDPAWVAEQARKGWRILPLTVGRQASCATNSRYRGKLISADPGDAYAKARGQGRVEARSTVAAARYYGIGRHSTMWFDLEHFDITQKRCRESALSFVSAWTSKLHDLGYRSGFYSSASSGIAILDDARILTPRKYHLPDQIWIGDWNGRANVRSTYISDDGWMPHARVHQFRGGHDERYGGVRINVDSNFMDVGRGSVAPKAPPHCGVQIDFSAYHGRHRGQRGKQVAAAQCFLRQQRLHKQRFYGGEVNGRFNTATYRAVKRFQGAHPSLRVTGKVTRRTWTVLLSAGPTPLMKYGAASNSVRRLQRALNAADSEGLDVTGVFEWSTRGEVKRYQRAHDLRATGVVTDAVWGLLQAGRV